MRLFKFWRQREWRFRKSRNRAVLMLMAGILVLPAAGYGAAEAQEAAEMETFDLDEIVVTATKTEQKERNTNASMAVITAETIADRHFSTVGQALNTIAGVSVRNKGLTGGAFADNTIYINGSDNVVLLVDGMRLNQNGNTNELFSTATLIDMDNIERIEVLRGSAATLYGSDAEGGVINIITKKKKKNRQTTKIGAQSGNFSQYAYKVVHQGREDGYFWNVDAMKQHTGAFREGSGRKIPEATDSENVSFTVGKDFGEKGSLSLSGSYFHSDSHRVNLNDAGGNPNADLFTLPQRLGRRYHRKFSLDWTYRFNDRVSNTLKVLQNNNDIRNDYMGTNTAKGIYYIKTTDINDYLSWQLNDAHHLLFGYEYTKDSLDYMYYSNQNYSGIDFTNHALYAQWRWDVTPQVNFTAGIRHDNNSEFGGHNSKSYALGYTPTDNTNVYLNFNEFFIAPRVVQIYSTRWGNRHLRPEYGHTWEIGADHAFNKNTSLKVSLFRRLAHNRIGLRRNRYTNFNHEDARGANIELSHRFSDRLRTSAGYSYMYIKAQDKANANRNGYVPRSEWKLSADYTLDKWQIGVTGRGTIRRDGRLANKVDKKATTFWVWDANINYRPTEQINVFLQVGNLFNQDYTERVYELDPNFWIASPGRSFLVGMEYTF